MSRLAAVAPTTVRRQRPAMLTERLCGRREGEAATVVDMEAMTGVDMETATTRPRLGAREVKEKAVW